MDDLNDCVTNVFLTRLLADVAKIELKGQICTGTGAFIHVKAQKAKRVFSSVNTLIFPEPLPFHPPAHVNHRPRNCHRNHAHAVQNNNSSSSCDALNTDRRVKDQPVNNLKMSSVDFSFCLSRLTVEEDPLAGRRGGWRVWGVGSAQDVNRFHPKLWQNLLSPLGTGINQQILPPPHPPPSQLHILGHFGNTNAEIMCVAELLNLLGGAHTEGEAARRSSHPAPTAGPPPICCSLFTPYSPATTNKI